MRNPYRSHVGSSVVVQTDDATLLGDLDAARADVLVLREAVIGSPGGRARMDGLVIIPLRRVAWVQVT